MDLTQLSDQDLLALHSGDLSKISDAALKSLSGNQPTQQSKTPLEQPNWFERQLAKLPDIPGASKGGPISGFVQGMADPSVGLGQIAANALPNSTGIPQAVNQGIENQNQGYEQARQQQGRGGFDAMRFAGNVLSPVNILGSKGIPSNVGMSAPALIGTGAAIGAAGGATQPVLENKDYWAKKTGQTAIGFAGGTLFAPLAAGMGRLVQPNATQRVKDLVDAGVQPTIGQALGGIANKAEETAPSWLPGAGYAVGAARNRSLESWNTATLNKALEPVNEAVAALQSGRQGAVVPAGTMTGDLSGLGGTVDSAGHDAVQKVASTLSSTYERAKGMLGGFKIDQQAQDALQNLQSLTINLPPKEAKVFQNAWDKISSQISPNGSLLADSYKNADSYLNSQISNFKGSGDAYQRQVGNALSEMKSILFENAKRANPEAASLLDAADAGWAQYARIRQAAAASASNKVNTGIFTPSQLLSATRSLDDTVGKGATAKGDALLQNWAQQGMNVIGDKVSNSGTIDRAVNGATAMYLASNPHMIIPAVAGAGAVSGAYTPMAQRLLLGAVTKRPEIAQALAKQLRQGATSLAPTTGNVLAQFLRSGAVAPQ